MLRRQKPGEFYNHPEHLSVVRRMLWRLGFDPLTVYERLEEVRSERDWYANALEEAQLHSIEARNPGINMETVRLDSSSQRTGQGYSAGYFASWATDR